MPSPADERIGARIAAARKRAGLTQRGLAMLIPYSYSLLRHVESGHRAASPQLVTAVARALHLPATALTGPSTQLRPDRVATLMRPLREALDLWDLPGPDEYRPTATVRDLTARADEVCTLVRATRLSHAAAQLPGLLLDLTMVCREAPSPTLWRALASTYRSTHDVAAKLAYPDLAALALDRMGWAADHASDAQLAAIRQYKRALSYRGSEAQHDIGLRMIRVGHAVLDQDQDRREVLAVTGQLHLGAAVLAARAGSCSVADEHLTEARDIASRTGEAGQVHALSFGPANVAAHETYARLELRQFDEAYTAARAVRPPRGWAVSRRAGQLVDRARAELETGRTDACLESLTAARRLAPQQTRFHPQAVETVRALLHLRRRSPDRLSQMAAWVGA